MQVRGLDNAMQWMGKDDARKKKRLEELCCSGMGNGEFLRLHQSNRWYHID